MTLECKVFIIVILFVLFFGVINNAFCSKKTKYYSIISEFSGIDLNGKFSTIYVVKSGENIGYKVNSSFFMTDYNTFHNTLTKKQKNYKWFVWQNKNDEFLRNKQHVYVLAIDREKSIIFCVNTDFNNSCIDNVTFSIFLKE